MIEVRGEKTHGSDDQDAQLQSPERKDWNECMSQEWQREECYRWKENGRGLSVGSKWTAFQKHGHRLTEEKPRIALSQETQSRSGMEGEIACISYFKGNRTNPSCNSWHCPACPNYQIVKGSKFHNKGPFRHVEADVQHSKKSEKWRRDRLPYWRSLNNLAAYPNTQTHRRNLLHGRARIGIIFCGHILESTRHTVVSQGFIQKCEPRTSNPCAPNFEDRTQHEKLLQGRCVRKEAWNLARNFLQDMDAFLSPTEVLVLSAPSSKKPHEREFEALMHMMCRQGLSTLSSYCQWWSANKWRIISIPSRPWALHYGAKSFKRRLRSDHYVNSPKNAVLLRELACGQKPQVARDGTIILGKTEIVVSDIVPGLSSRSGTNSSSTSLLQDLSRISSTPATEARDDPAPRNSTERSGRSSTKKMARRDSLKPTNRTKKKNNEGWGKPLARPPRVPLGCSFRRTLRIVRNVCIQKHLCVPSSDSTRSSERLKMRGLQANQIYEDSLQHAHKRSSASGRNISDSTQHLANSSKM